MKEFVGEAELQIEDGAWISVLVNTIVLFSPAFTNHKKQLKKQYMHVTMYWSIVPGIRPPM